MGAKLDRSLFVAIVFVSSIRIQLLLKQLGVFFNSYSDTLRLKWGQ